MSFAGKCIELEIIMLSEINQDQRTNIMCSLSHLESRQKKKVNDTSVKRELFGEGTNGKREGERRG
jgi:hypothetical protein